VHVLDAQEVSVGDRVRVQSEVSAYTYGERQETKTVKTTGVLSGLANDSLHIDTSGQDFVSIHVPSVSKLEVSLGQNNRTLKGMAIGTGIGFGAGFVFAFAVASAADGEYSAAGFGLVYGALGAGVGLVIGTIIGALSSGDVWQEVPVGNLQVSVAPTGLTLRVPM
jgi:hypothetical protein